MAVTPVACISLHETDKIRVMNLPPNVVDSLRAVINSSWESGLQSEAIYAISYQFKLNGNPWKGNSKDANDSRRLIARILHVMLQQGWAIITTTGITKHENDKDTLYFQQRIPESNILVSAISFNMRDRIRVIDGTAEMTQVVRSTIQNCWHRGLQDEKTYYGVPEFKMVGSPWDASGTDTVHARIFLAQLINALDEAGWDVYTSVNITSGGERGKVDTWVMRTKEHRKF